MMNISTTDVYAYSTHMVMSPSKVGMQSLALLLMWGRIWSRMELLN